MRESDLCRLQTTTTKEGRLRYRGRVAFTWQMEISKASEEKNVIMTWSGGLNMSATEDTWEVLKMKLSFHNHSTNRGSDSIPGISFHAKEWPEEKLSCPIPPPAHVPGTEPVVGPLWEELKILSLQKACALSFLLPHRIGPEGGACTCQ